MEVEECDLGTRNTDGDPDNHACTTTCKVSDKNKWRCTKISDGNGRWTSQCEWLCGNQVVDWREEDGIYENDNSGLGTYTAMG